VVEVKTVPGLRGIYFLEATLEACGGFGPPIGSSAELLPPRRNIQVTSAAGEEGNAMEP